MSFWHRPKSVPPTPSEAARTLGAIARQNAVEKHQSETAKRAATLSRLRACVDSGRIAYLGWKA
jgi:hypothetical protein